MLYDPKKLLLILGPCMLESEAIAREIAEELVKIREQEPCFNIIFKGSFDKANRTSLQSPRGPGMEAGLKLLASIKEDYSFPVCTDIHTPEQAAPVGEVCDVLQIPAFLCRQTDLLVAAAKTGRVVQVKKGQFLAPQDMKYAINKLEESQASEIWQTERGATFGYQNLVVDMRSFPIMQENGHPVLLDATHSVQLPGGAQGASSGNREYVPTLARAAIAAGANGLFIETHPNPDQALSDGKSQIPLRDLFELLKHSLALWRVTNEQLVRG